MIKLDNERSNYMLHEHKVLERAETGRPNGDLNLLTSPPKDARRPGCRMPSAFVYLEFRASEAVISRSKTIGLQEAPGMPTNHQYMSRKTFNRVAKARFRKAQPIIIQKLTLTPMF